MNVAESLGLGEEGSGEEHVVLLQMPDLLPSPAPPPAVDAAAAKLRHLRREDAPPAPVALSLKDLPSGKVNNSKKPGIKAFRRSRASEEGFRVMLMILISYAHKCACISSSE